MSKRLPDEIRLQMRNDRETHGLSIYALAQKYKCSPSSAHFIIKGCDDAKVVHAMPGKRAASTVSAKARPLLSKVNIGEATRQIIIGKLMWHGIKAYKPISEDTVVDLLVRKTSGQVLLCQCKYIYPTDNGCHCMSLSTTRVNHSNHTSYKHRYSETEVDIFLGYCFDNDSVYVIPNKDTAGRIQLRFWILRPKYHGNNMTPLATELYRERFDYLT